MSILITLIVIIIISLHIKNKPSLGYSFFSNNYSIVRIDYNSKHTVYFDTVYSRDNTITNYACLPLKQFKRSYIPIPKIEVLNLLEYYSKQSNIKWYYKEKGIKAICYNPTFKNFRCWDFSGKVFTVNENKFLKYARFEELV